MGKFDEMQIFIGESEAAADASLAFSYTKDGETDPVFLFFLDCLGSVSRKARARAGAREEEAAAWIEAVVEKLQRAGALNDRAYAEGRVVSLRRQGESARGIAMKLGAKGVPREAVEAALELDEPENDDVAAAVAYARRRRLGPWRKPDEREERHDRDMAALARKGYRLDLCRRVIEAQDAFAAEELARGED